MGKEGQELHSFPPKMLQSKCVPVGDAGKQSEELKMLHLFTDFCPFSFFPKSLAEDQGTQSRLLLISHSYFMLKVLI